MKHGALKKTLIKLLLPFGLTLLLLFSRDFLLQYTVSNPGAANIINIGTTFIQMNAEALNLDWKAAYKEIINEIGIKYIRIPIFWDQIEPEPGVFNWSAIEWQMQEAAKAKAKVLLVVGHRVPRYPECYAPTWTHDLNDQQFKQALFRMLKATVLHFKDHSALEAWQIENEPLAKILGKIWGGQQCREVIPWVAEEIQLVRSLDTHPTVVTYAFSPWTSSQLRDTLAFNSDVVAITLFNKLFFRSPLYSGYIEMFKMGLISPLRLAYQKAVAEHQGKQFWIAELQAEPWGPDGPYQFEHPEDAYISMNPERLAETWKYATQAGISKLYLWGAEWWLAERNKGNASMLNAVKELMADHPIDSTLKGSE
jgi:hypothetical protein